ncbi:acyl-CoA dehydrogenase family protein [Novosphingobium sp. MMS21-SN21R]|uniref:acyl-CoA dehydrogenase family protein n=1 Tax=Novosphingobium sp. MMS21-SN21R TaxID=2969298 RepID=UPI0028868A52|nr:acyl-CoA dehydrogenase family protein [Novosphingobium sp. MMS21-SN21R]MDT0509792.1 acyl-CoA dehydrogenase family protein [Novosphingobium sp. MMS21-SN21R]
MQFAFTEDQLTITQAAREMLVETCTPADLRKQLEAASPRDDARWATIAEMGLIALLAPEDAGGLGMGLVDLIGIAEAAGYVGLPEPLIEQAGIVVPLLARLEDNRGWLDKVLAGAVVVVGHPINPFVANADSADAFLLADGDDIHLVTADAVTITRAESFDPFRRLFTVSWTPSATTLVGEGWGDTAERGALLAAAEMIGLAQRCIDLAVSYAKDRVQFGKPIGTTQAIKHMIASAQVKVEFARPVVHAAAAELPLGTLPARARVAHAKIAAGAAADIASRMSVQAHGAMGMTWEVDLHFYLKRAFSLNYAWGTQAQQFETVQERIAAERMGPDATFASALTQ